MRARIVVVALLAAACGKDPPKPAAPNAPEPASAPAAARPERAPSKVIGETFHSDALGVDKDVKIYLPAGYDPDDARRYPVLYYLHGLGGDETNWLTGGKLDAAADALALEAIVVMPDGDNHFYIDSALDTTYDACLKDGQGLYLATQPRDKTCVRASRYETYVVRDLIGWVDRTYKTIARREARGIAGLSMGGFGALALGMRHPELFAAVASHSGLITPLYKGPFPYEKGKVELHDSIASVTTMLKLVGSLGTWTAGVFGNDLAVWRAYDPTVLAAKLAPGTLQLYLDCGTEDEFLFNHSVAYLHDLLLDRGIAHEYYLGPGHHSFAFWRERVPHSLAFFRDRLAKAR